MARPSPYESGELTDAMLVILACTEKPVHGYGLMQRVKGFITLGPATMYTTLARMLEVQWLEELPGVSDEAKREYHITDLGRSVLRADIARRERLLATVRTIVQGDSQ